MQKRKKNSTEEGGNRNKNMGLVKGEHFDLEMRIKEETIEKFAEILTEREGKLKLLIVERHT